jgi:hypothetical protein
MWPAERQIGLLSARESPPGSWLAAPVGPLAAPPVSPPLSAKYRSSSRFNDAQVDAALELLSTNDHQELQRTRDGEFTKTQRTWAALAQGVAAALGRALVGGGDMDSTLERCELLAHRLEARDAIPSARVTAALRGEIDLVVKAARAVSLLRRVADGRLPSDRDAMLITTLRSLWRRLSEAYGGSDWPVELVQHASGKVLASSASTLIKSLFARAVAHWSPTPPTGPAEPTAKRAKADEHGERISFDSDDEDF